MIRKPQVKQTPQALPVTLPRLIIPRSEAEDKLREHVAKGRNLTNQTITSEEMMLAVDAEGDKWRDRAIKLLAALFDSSVFADEYRAKTQQISIGGRLSFVDEWKFFKERMNHRWIKELEAIVESLDLLQEAPVAYTVEQTNAINNPRAEALEKVVLIAQRFHTIVRQLKQRHKNRPTLEVTDEYDAQDLFHMLLRLFFDDVRDEEWTPSYAGGSSRIDFLLKEEQIVLELKMTRPGLRKKEVGDQLLIDIARYRTAHPDCKMMVAFVYDPMGFIANPRELEVDLSKELEGIQIKVMINPH